MDRIGRLPPRLSCMEGALRFIANFRNDGADNNECHYTIGMEMRRRTRSWRVYHFDQRKLTLRFAGQALLDYFAPRGFFQNRALLRFVLAAGQCRRKRSNSRRKGSTIEAPPAYNLFLPLVCAMQPEVRLEKLASCVHVRYLRVDVSEPHGYSPPEIEMN